MSPDSEGSEENKASLPAYLRQPECLASCPDARLLSKPDDRGQYVSLDMSRLVLASTSSFLHALLLEHEMEEGGGTTVHISTELAADSLELFCHFATTGCLARERIGNDLHLSFLSLGVDLEWLDLRKTNDVERSPAGDEDDETSPMEAEAEEMLRFWSFYQNINQAAWERAQKMPDSAVETDVTFKEGDFFGAVPESEVRIWKKNRVARKKRMEKELKEWPELAKKPKKVTPASHKLLFRCDTCSFTSEHSQEFVYHVLKRHKYAGKNLDWFCVFCEAGFETKIELKAHEKKEHPSRRCTCPLCGLDFSFIAHRYFLAHVERHCGTKFLLCSQCGKEFANIDKWSKHMNKMGPYHSSECAQCPVGKFPILSWREYQRHIKVAHGGTFKHVCGLCPKLFDTKHQARVHKRLTHPLGQWTKVCDICGETIMSDRRKIHMRQHHPEEMEKLGEDMTWPKGPNGCPPKRERLRLDPKFNPPDYYTFNKEGGGPCIVCGKVLSGRLQYKTHYIRKHLPDGQKPYQCSYCPKGYAAKIHLKEHENAQHKKIKEVKCRFDGCEKVFSTTGVRSDHERLTHRGIKRVRRIRVKRE